MDHWSGILGVSIRPNFIRPQCLMLSSTFSRHRPLVFRARQRITQAVLRHHCASVPQISPITPSDGSELKLSETSLRPIRKNNQDDHRSLGTNFSLFTTHSSSPGSPLFHPDGTHILQKLQAFLRAQYPIFGIQEVLTPIIYKKSLWQRSGHWTNYMFDMFTVTGRHAHTSQGTGTQEREGNAEEEYGLKPMNCPGHCLLFQSQKRSYKELPIRYADFSPLHRNEISGSLSGLSRLRRFHQDDGHIFCRPAQVGQEIQSTLNFVRMVYETFDLGSYKLLLSTRPETKFIGTVPEWERAETQLTVALEKSGSTFEISKGDGAFYGPKIDVILTDGNGKKHQTATIQLDFQLPQRFGLEYHSPAPMQEACGIETTDPDLVAQMGMVTPVIIHRAILGSLERFMALLVERYQGHWPFWLSPRQMIILPVSSDSKLNEHAQNLAAELRAPGARQHRRKLDAQTFTVDVDHSNRSLAKKVSTAKLKRYNIVGVIGTRNMQADTIDLTLSEEPSSKRRRDIIASIKGRSHAPLPENPQAHDNISVSLTKEECIALMMRFCDEYI